MAVELIPARVTPRLTQENHPENAQKAAPQVKMSLASMIGISALCGLIGMVLGSAALSTAFMNDTNREVLTLLPLVATVACLVSGWAGAFFWMTLDDK